MNIPILTVYDSQGNEIPIPAIKGADGAKGDTGAAGPQGQPGTNGQDGHTPVKGVDYWTNTDKAEIIGDVLDEIYQGADIGLQIVCQLNAPGNPSDNMIWVETETAMPVGKYIVSSRQPTAGLVNGFIWLREMYLPKVEITIPGSHVSLSIAQVWQYENGAWVWKNGHVYKASDTSWHDTGVYWFKSGTGFNTAVFGATWKNHDTIIVSEDNEYVRMPGNTSSFSCQTFQDAGKFKYLIIEAEASDIAPTVYQGRLIFGISSTNVADGFMISQYICPPDREEATLDISAANTDYILKTYTSYASANIYNIWLV